MKFHAQVERDGDDLLLRIPDAIRRAQGLRFDDSVEITIRRSRTREQALNELHALGQRLRLPPGFRFGCDRSDIHE